jgi:prepilin-type N-terminal cleavage/methylation domain-containing protein
MFIAQADREAILDTGRWILDGNIIQHRGSGIRHRAFRRSAFTLLEITLAVAILAMMSLAIYRFVQSNLTAIRLSATGVAADAQYDGLRDLLTAQWQSLPSGKGALLGEPFKFNDKSRDEIKWICGPGPGLLTRYAPGDFVVTLRLQRPNEKSDQLDLGVLRKPKDDSSITNEDETWVPLISDVQGLEVRYFDSRVNTWVAKWTDTMTLPRLVKVTVARSDSPVPWEVIVPLGRTPL